ncbi:tRNA U-34 5-methylaminomethyl-2-thiouridine biosynthesis protein [Sporosarcina sp. FSL K6-2383]|uniref:tRNA U-34 5-methylaminomethyl-2-thiouridine biosynthesis protein n=1 Tax=Sporosarcina sp. FSL K6-2383 TaxID=2921556 RepID=UPI00315B1BCC
MSKNLIFLIAGTVFAWLVIRLITKDFESGYLITIIIGVFLGYQIGKKEPGNN